MEPYTSRHAGVVSAIRAITKLESIKSKRAKHSIGGVDLSSHICEGWPPRSQSSGVLAFRCRYLSHPRERSEGSGYWLTVFIKLPPLSASLCETSEKSACSLSSREGAGCRDTHGTSRVTVHFEMKLVALSHAVVDEW